MYDLLNDFKQDFNMTDVEHALLTLPDHLSSSHFWWGSCCSIVSFLCSFFVHIVCPFSAVYLLTFGVWFVIMTNGTISGHFLHRYSIPVHQVMVATVKLLK
jgi:hypothetical protein